jgi:hypothetical protein
MSFVASGKKREMVGQSFKYAQLERDTVQQENINGIDISNPAPDVSPVEQKASTQPVQNKKDLSEEIINLMKTWGWPPRKILNYRENLVKESYFKKDGVLKKKISVTVPNFYFSDRSGTLSEEDFQKLVSTVEEVSGLKLEKGGRSGISIVLEFVSDEQPKVDDVDRKLEQVFGKDTKSASTLSELINSRKQELYEKLRSIGENK